MKAIHQSTKHIMSMLITSIVQTLEPTTIDELIDIMTMFKETAREVEQEYLRNYFRYMEKNINNSTTSKQR